MSRSARNISIVSVVIIAAAFAVYAMTRPAHRASETNPVKISADTVMVSDKNPAEPEPSPVMDPETGAMVKAKAELQAEYAQHKGDLPADVAKPIDKDIGMIEGAAADLVAALAREPDNQDLKRMLISTYRNELRLLKQALHLSSAAADEPAEDAAPAAK